MLVACLGDVMLDVVVSTDSGLVHDDDVPAEITFSAGGQAANVAAWVRALGGDSLVFGPRSDSAVGRLVEASLKLSGVELHGPVTARPGAVMSLIAQGQRSMASDPGTSTWLEQVDPGAWLDDADWLFVSGYALLRSTAPEQLLQVARVARDQGTRVAVDLASATMITAYGTERFASLWQQLAPDVVFANDEEWRTVSARQTASSGGTALVLKHAARGATFVTAGAEDHRTPVPGEVVDATGAGDALAAGYLLGGADLAMVAAARCVSARGAQPRRPAS